MTEEILIDISKRLDIEPHDPIGRALLKELLAARLECAQLRANFLAVVESRDRLRADLLAAADRIAAQSDLLAARAGKPSAPLSDAQNAENAANREA